MGQSDIRSSDYFESNERFADVCNGILYEGDVIIKPEELSEADVDVIYTDVKHADKKIRDKVKRFKGIQIAILVLENQDYVDYRMVFRNMLTEAMEYNKQWKRKLRKHRQQKDLKDRHEYLSGMKIDEIYEPVITLVLYLGTDKEWDGPTQLYQLLDMEHLDDKIKSFITDYRLNIFDFHVYENFEIFKSEVKYLFEYLANSKDKEKMAECMQKNREGYSNLEADTVQLISTLTHTKGLERYQNQTTENMEGGYDMCKAFEDMKLEGIELGRAEGKAEAIIELLEEAGTVPSSLRDRILSQKDMLILKEWHKKAAKVDTIDDFINQISQETEK